MRFSEIAKYSDGTLEVTRLQLDSRLQINDQNRAENRMPTIERSLLVRALINIDERTSFRRAMRRIETYLGLRRRRRPFLP